GRGQREHRVFEGLFHRGSGGCSGESGCAGSGGCAGERRGLFGRRSGGCSGNSCAGGYGSSGGHPTAAPAEESPAAPADTKPMSKPTGVAPKTTSSADLTPDETR